MAKVTLTSKSSAMKSYLPLLTFAVLLTSCSSVYKSGQTPDDVYYSPARPQEEYVRVEKKNDRMYGNRNNDYTLEDQYLRMKTRNRRYAFLEDDYDCYCYGNSYNRYHDYYRMNTYYGGYYSPNVVIWNRGYGNHFYNSYYNPYYYNPYYGNPYYSGVVYGNVSPVYNKPRTTNLRVFDGNGSNYNPNMPKGNGRTFDTNSSGNNDNYRGSGTNAGGFLRNVFGTGNNSNSSSSNSTMSTQPSSSNSSSNSGSSSSGSSHAPVRKF
jgi:hypothetical protein